MTVHYKPHGLGTCCGCDPLVHENTTNITKVTCVPCLVAVQEFVNARLETHEKAIDICREFFGEFGCVMAGGNTVNTAFENVGKK